MHFVLVILDQEDLNQIEIYEKEFEHEEKYSQTQQYQSSLSSYTPSYHQIYSKPPQPNNNLPAFETLFKGNRQNVNRLASSGPLTDSEDDEESSSICRKGKRG